MKILTRLYSKYHYWKYDHPSKESITYCLTLKHKLNKKVSANILQVAQLYDYGFPLWAIALQLKITRERARQCLLKFERDMYKYEDSKGNS
jgi:hypothetical protein